MFDNVIGEIAKFAAGITGMAQIVSAAGSAMRAFGDVAKAAGAVFKAAFSVVTEALSSLAKSLMNASKGLVGIFEALGGVIGTFIGTIVAIPLAALSAIPKILDSLLSAFTSLMDAAAKLTTGLFLLGAAAAPGGMKVFSQVIQYLTTVIGSVATPIFLSLTAVLLSLAEYLKGPMLQAAQSLAKWLAENLTEAIKTTIKWFIEVFNAVDKYGTMVVNAFDTVVVALLNFKDNMAIVADYISAVWHTIMSGLADGLYKMLKVLSYIPGFGKITGSELKKESEDEQAKADAGAQDIADRRSAIDKRNAEEKGRQDARTKGSEERGAGRQAAAPGIMDTVDKIMKDFGGSAAEALNAMQQEFAKQANVGFSGIADIQKTIQSQSFQTSIPTRQLDTQIKILDILKNFVNQGQGNPQPAAIGP